MTLKFRFSLFLILTLIFVILSNLLAVRISTLRHFENYRQEVSEFSAQKSFKLLEQVLNPSTSSGNIISEYQWVFRDLNHIDDTLSHVESALSWVSSKDLETTDSLQEWKTDKRELLSFSDLLASVALFSPKFFGDYDVFSGDTPEAHLFQKILKDLVIFNLVLLSCCLIAWSYLFRRNLAPIHALQVKVNQVAQTWEYFPIRYVSKDEFSPLVESINQLMSTIWQEESTRSQFISDLSHEIRTPLMALSCLCEALSDGVIPLTQKEIENIQAQVNRIQKISEQILQYQKLEYREDWDNLQREVIDIEEYYEKITTIYQELLLKKHQSTRFVVWSHKFVVADAIGLERIFHNIFTNFLKYAWDNTLLSFRVAYKKGMIHIIAEDNGVWTNEYNLTRLHQKFYRVRSDRPMINDSLQGAWLGLSIVSRVMQQHGGFMKLEQARGWHGLKIILAFPE